MGVERQSSRTNKIKVIRYNMYCYYFFKKKIKGIFFLSNCSNLAGCTENWKINLACYIMIKVPYSYVINFMHKLSWIYNIFLLLSLQCNTNPMLCLKRRRSGSVYSPMCHRTPCKYRRNIWICAAKPFSFKFQLFKRR